MLSRRWAEFDVLQRANCGECPRPHAARGPFCPTPLLPFKPRVSKRAQPLKLKAIMIDVSLMPAAPAAVADDTVASVPTEGGDRAIFDMMMPHLQGLDIIRYMRTEKRLMRIPAMMMTSEKDLKLMVDSFNAGATLFLSKPFTTERLQMTLRMLLGLGQEAQEEVLTMA